MLFGWQPAMKLSQIGPSRSGPCFLRQLLLPAVPASGNLTAIRLISVAASQPYSIFSSA